MALLDFPIGTIIAWGNGTVPAGWAKCNGTGGTPNLIGKFIRGASVDEDVRTTGGVSSHAHANPNTNSREPHNHGGSKAASVGGAGSVNATSGTGASGAPPPHTHLGTIYITPADEHDHTVRDTSITSILPRHGKRVFIRRMT